MLENKLDEMALKILTLETELVEIKQNNSISTKEEANPNEKMLGAFTRKVLELEGKMKNMKANSKRS